MLDLEINESRWSSIMNEYEEEVLELSNYEYDEFDDEFESDAEEM